MSLKNRVDALAARRQPARAGLVLVCTGGLPQKEAERKIAEASQRVTPGGVLLIFDEG
jgi:hypothetical protein